MNTGGRSMAPHFMYSATFSTVSVAVAFMRSGRFSRIQRMPVSSGS